MKNSECHGKAWIAFHHTLFLICVSLGVVRLASDSFVSLNIANASDATVNSRLASVDSLSSNNVPSYSALPCEAPSIEDEDVLASNTQSSNTQSSDTQSSDTQASNTQASESTAQPYTVYRLFGNRGTQNAQAESDRSLSGQVVLLDFYSDYCGPCRSMMPVVDRLRARGYAVRKINTSHEAALAQRMHVHQIPCFVVMVDGKEYTRCVGTTSERALEQMIVQASKQVIPTERIVQNTETCDVQQTAAIENQRSAWHGREVNVAVADIVRNPQMFPVTDQSMNELRLATSSTPQTNVPQPVNPPPFPAAASIPATQASLNQSVGSNANVTTGNTTAATSGNTLASNTDFPLQNIDTADDQVSTVAQPSANPNSVVSATVSADAQPYNTGAPAFAIPLKNDLQAPASNLHQKALASSVRINIYGEDTQDCGTGTIIDARSGRALVLTCGHLFRDYKAGSRITVDFFGDNGQRGVEARYVGHDLERDLGLLSVPVSRPVIVMPLASKDYALNKGMDICTSGCSHGADPTIQTGTVTQIGRYLGPSNIEVSAVPVQGRSGGGLFTQDHHLIGVCVAADAEYKEGMFTSLPAIHEYLEQMQLDRIACNPRNESLSLVTSTAQDITPVPQASETTGTEDDEPIMLLTDLQMKNATVENAQAPQAQSILSAQAAPAAMGTAPTASTQATFAPAAAPATVPATAAPTEFPEVQSIPAQNVSQPMETPRVISIDGQGNTPETTVVPSAGASNASSTAGTDTTVQTANLQNHSLTGEPTPAWPPQWK